MAAVLQKGKRRSTKNRFIRSTPASHSRPKKEKIKQRKYAAAASDNTFHPEAQLGGKGRKEKGRGQDHLFSGEKGKRRPGVLIK